MTHPVAFKDHFSDVSADYGRYRPRYPAALFAWLASVSPARQRAWDCATGTGQAALGLSAYFLEVVATDASVTQIAAATVHPGVDYRVALAEASGLESASVDLVTVAQALHWFDVERFYAEVRRVLRPGGILAVWSYDLMRVGPAVDACIDRLHDEVAPFWPPERGHVASGYRALPFPFEGIKAPPFAMSAEWRLPTCSAICGPGRRCGAIGRRPAVMQWRRTRPSSPNAGAHR